MLTLPPPPCPTLPYLSCTLGIQQQQKHFMDALKSVPLGGLGVVDTMKLVVLGGTVKTACRVSSSAWMSFVNCESTACESTPADMGQCSSLWPTSVKRTISLAL